MPQLATKADVDSPPDRPQSERAGAVSASNLTPADPLVTERQAREDFASRFSALEYRKVLSHLYPRWHVYNKDFFNGRLKIPHIGIGRTHPRRFSQCRLTTDYGGVMDITLDERIVFAEATRVVRDPWPAGGLVRFLDDLLLGEAVKQFVLEVRGSTEEGYGGYGPLFAAEATRIGREIGLPRGDVLARRRALRGRGEPVAAFWPWAFRDEGYYLGQVRLGHLSVAGVRTAPPNRHAPVPGVFDYLLYLVVTNQTARLHDVLARQVDSDAEARSPSVAAFERGPHDPSGMPLPAPHVEGEWLEWNSGCVKAIAEGILARRQFGVMPILADALQDAGCEDPVLLDHCRANTEHTGNCWALKALLAGS